MLLDATLVLNRRSIPLSAFVDSGADENFLDASFATQAGIAVEPLAAPLDANALDGKLIARVTHTTELLKLVLSGNHHEAIRFHVIPSPHTPLILGQPWLKRHNPHFDWVSGRVVSWSTSCHSSCLRSALSPAQAAVPLPAPAPPDLSTVPACYHDLGEVFSKHHGPSPSL